MMLSNSNSACMHARLYYHDFLGQEGETQVPETALKHIAQCQHCQAEISRLKVLLSDAKKRIDTAQSQKNSAVSATLRLHLAYIGQSVTCSTIKAFLPSLVVPGLQINIPTPITAHVDNCQACSNDLLAIKNLCLTHNQLHRLGQILAEGVSPDTVNCSQAQAAIPSVAAVDFTKTSPEVLKHLGNCPDCRELLYQRRETIRVGLPPEKLAHKQFPCEKIKTTDIFDYCFPYGIDLAGTKGFADFGTLASHLRTCPACLDKMQQLHRTIYSVVERPDSEVITCFNFKEQITAEAEPRTSDLYADWPINVGVLDKSKPGADTILFWQMLQQRAIQMNLKQFVKPAVATAAVVLIACALFVSTPVVKAVDLSEIYEALEKIKNVCILRLAPGKTEPIQTEWVSQTLNIRMFKTRDQFVLWDVPNKVRKIRDSSSDTVVVTSVTEDVITKLQNSINSSFGLMPFSSITDVPENAQWNRVYDTDVVVAVPGTEVYDLTWTESAGAITEYRRWRVFVDPDTKLPRRTESYRKMSTDDEHMLTLDDAYTLTALLVMEYPTDSELKALMQNSFER